MISDLITYKVVNAVERLKHPSILASVVLDHYSISSFLKPLQNKKGQKNLGYPRKKQSFYKEKDCFFLGYAKFFWPFLSWSGFSTRKIWLYWKLVWILCLKISSKCYLWYICNVEYRYRCSNSYVFGLLQYLSKQYILWLDSC